MVLTKSPLCFSCFKMYLVYKLVWTLSWRQQQNLWITLEIHQEDNVTAKVSSVVTARKTENKGDGGGWPTSSIRHEGRILNHSRENSLDLWFVTRCILFFNILDSKYFMIHETVWLGQQKVLLCSGFFHLPCLEMLMLLINVCISYFSCSHFSLTCGT